jgi:hypothetical protein
MMVYIILMASLREPTESKREMEKPTNLSQSRMVLDLTFHQHLWSRRQFPEIPMPP